MTTSKSAPRRTPRTKAVEEKPSVVDQMAEDAAADSVEYPEGAPEFLVPLAIKPRSRRAEFKRCYAKVLENYERTDELRRQLSQEDPPMSKQMEIMAELDEVYQAIVDTLSIAAVAPDEFQVWADEVDDADLLQTFNAYNTRTQPGEASSSAS